VPLVWQRHRGRHSTAADHNHYTERELRSDKIYTPLLVLGALGLCCKEVEVVGVVDVEPTVSRREWIHRAASEALYYYVPVKHFRTGYSLLPLCYN
jgi:hypothetical protein